MNQQRGLSTQWRRARRRLAASKTEHFLLPSGDRHIVHAMVTHVMVVGRRSEVSTAATRGVCFTPISKLGRVQKSRGLTSLPSAVRLQFPQDRAVPQRDVSTHLLYAVVHMCTFVAWQSQISKNGLHVCVKRTGRRGEDDRDEAEGCDSVASASRHLAICPLRTCGFAGIRIYPARTPPQPTSGGGGFKLRLAAPTVDPFNLFFDLAKDFSKSPWQSHTMSRCALRSRRA